MDYSLAFLAGFLGSMHCVGMCGAIVLAYSSQGIQLHASPLMALGAHLTYNAGRVLSCTIVGVLLGFLGQGLGALQGIGHWFSFSAGILLVVSGILLLKIIPLALFEETLNLGTMPRSAVHRLYRASLGALIALPKLESKFYIGLLTPLIPCGLLYSMFLKAAESGSALKGGMTMLLFGLGIVPALVVTGYASTYFGSTMRRWGDTLAAVTILVMGVLLILRGLGIPLPWMSGGHGAMH